MKRWPHCPKKLKAMCSICRVRTASPGSSKAPANSIISYTAVKYGIPHIRAGGSIVLTTGVAGARPRKGWTVAASICSAMEGLTRALAVELAPVRVNAVSPGVVRSPFWGAMSEHDREAMYRDASARLPVGRVGEVDDIAEAYLYLMRENFSTGQVIVVDGGTVLV